MKRRSPVLCERGRHRACWLNARVRADRSGICRRLSDRQSAYGEPDSVCQGCRVATSGKLKITVHPNGSLFKAPEITRAVRKRAGADRRGSDEPAGQPEPSVRRSIRCRFWQPGSMTRGSCGRRSGPWSIALLAKRGLKLLYAVAWPPQGIYAKKELNTAGRHEGAQVARVQPRHIHDRAAVGAQPLTIQAAELSQALADRRRSIRSCRRAPPESTSKVWETLTHFHTVDAWLPKNMVIVNQQEFDKLDKPTQDSVVKAASQTPSARAGNACVATPTNRSAIVAQEQDDVVKPSPQLNGRL